MKIVVQTTLTIIVVLAVWWIVLRLALPYLSYERITWMVTGFFFVAGIVVILRARRNKLIDEGAQLTRRKQTMQGWFYLAVAVLLAILSGLVFKLR